MPGSPTVQASPTAHAEQLVQEQQAAEGPADFAVFRPLDFSQTTETASDAHSPGPGTCGITQAAGMLHAASSTSTHAGVRAIQAEDEHSSAVSLQPTEQPAESASPQAAPASVTSPASSQIAAEQRPDSPRTGSPGLSPAAGEALFTLPRLAQTWTLPACCRYIHSWARQPHHDSDRAKLKQHACATATVLLTPGTELM